MAIIKADNPDIEKLLRKLVSLVEEGGGGVHSDLVIRDTGGNLSIETKDAMAQGREIIRLSRDVLLPSDKYDVVVRGNEFTPVFPEKGGLTPLQQKIAETMMALYTVTGKAALHKEYSFLLSMREFPDLMGRIDTMRIVGKDMVEWRTAAEKGLTGADLDDFIGKTFLKTRYLGYTDPIRTSSVSILMPVVDFLNHHWSGATFTVGQGVRKGDLCVMSSTPVSGSPECYAFYGMMDALDALIRYDFVDDFAPVVRSVPVELEVPGYGNIIINSQINAIAGKKLAKQVADLSRFMPRMVLDKKESRLYVSHALIPVQDSPLALRRMLNIYLVNLAGGVPEESFRKSWVRQAERRIVEANIEAYRGLLDHAQGLATGAKAKDPGLARIVHLAELQLGKLSRYQFAESQTAPGAAA